jgi:hypothetical protein
MANPKPSSRRDAPSNATSEHRPRPRRFGTHGYPYAPTTTAGDIHWGSGFSGIGSRRGPLGSSGILTERGRVSRRSLEDDETLDQ